MGCLLQKGLSRGLDLAIDGHTMMLTLPAGLGHVLNVFYKFVQAQICS
jgi:hypothetical protein